MLKVPEPNASTATGVPSGAVMQTNISLVPDCAMRFSFKSKLILNLSTLLAVEVLFSLPLLFSSTPTILKLDACKVEPTFKRSSFSLMTTLAESYSLLATSRCSVTACFSLVSCIFSPSNISTLAWYPSKSPFKEAIKRFASPSSAAVAFALFNKD